MNRQFQTETLPGRASASILIRACGNASSVGTSALTSGSRNLRSSAKPAGITTMPTTTPRASSFNAVCNGGPPAAARRRRPSRCGIFRQKANKGIGPVRSESRLGSPLSGVWPETVGRGARNPLDPRPGTRRPIACPRSRTCHGTDGRVIAGDAVYSR